MYSRSLSTEANTGTININKRVSSRNNLLYDRSAFNELPIGLLLLLPSKQ